MCWRGGGRDEVRLCRGRLRRGLFFSALDVIYCWVHQNSSRPLGARTPGSGVAEDHHGAGRPLWRSNGMASRMAARPRFDFSGGRGWFIYDTKFDAQDTTSTGHQHAALARAARLQRPRALRGLLRLPFRFRPLGLAGRAVGCRSLLPTSIPGMA